MTAPTELRRSLGFTDLLLITIGTVIGSGIYLVPSVVLRQTGGQTSLALIVWAVAGVLSRPPHDELVRLGVEVALLKRRRVQRIEQLLEIRDVHLDQRRAWRMRGAHAVRWSPG